MGLPQVRGCSRSKDSHGEMRDPSTELDGLSMKDQFSLYPLTWLYVLQQTPKHNWQTHAGWLVPFFPSAVDGHRDLSLLPLGASFPLPGRRSQDQPRRMWQVLRRSGEEPSKPLRTVDMTTPVNSTVLGRSTQ